MTVDYGPLNAEFQGGDQEELQDNLVEFVEFLEENDDVFDAIRASYNGNGGSATSDINAGYIEEGTEEQTNGESVGEVEEEDHPLKSLARNANTSTETLDDIIYVDPDGEEKPQLLVSKKHLGGTKAERQRTAAYILLRVWEDCYGEERMKTSELKSLLTMANIKEDKLYNAWKGAGKGDFDPTGRGESATVGLTGPGRRQAIKVLQQLVESYQAE